MKLKKILKDITVADIKGSKEVEISGIGSHSKRMAPGNLFIAKKGRTVDGSRFIHEAIEGGAVAVLTDIYDPTLKSITQLIHPDVASIEGAIAAAYHHNPSQELLTIGITGTNGKTTTSYLIKHLLDAVGLPCGLIGTIEYITGNHRVQAGHTTPDVVTNQKLLREMANHGCKAAVMEVTSHALDQGRVSQIAFDVAIFTNLTPEHLDYHANMEEYGKAKGLLFRSLKTSTDKKQIKAAIVNADDPYSTLIAKDCSVAQLSYGIERPADVRAYDIELSAKKTCFNIAFQGAVHPIELPLIGRFNIYNSLAAIACGVSQKIPMPQIIKALESFTSVPGRLEFVPNPLDLKIYVDFAHTPDALNNVLQCIKEFTKGRIITVFGCGGDRDPFKRPIMGEVAENYSALSILTSDNPRSEEPLKIIEEIAKGFRNPNNYMIEPDRRLAISKALTLASPEDIILIAGRGHEPYQTFARYTVAFNDCDVARALCISRKGTL